MKAVLTFFTLAIISLNLNAKEVSLLCKGEVQYIREKPSLRIYEINFDDQKNRILSMTAELSKGCLLDSNDEFSRARSCNCKVTINEISCESIAEGKKFTDHLHEDNFYINRRTGRMTTSSSFTGKDFSFFSTGELTCEKIISNKF